MNPIITNALIITLIIQVAILAYAVFSTLPPRRKAVQR